jgi:hypothetical protein
MPSSLDGIGFGAGAGGAWEQDITTSARSTHAHLNIFDLSIFDYRFLVDR